MALVPVNLQINFTANYAGQHRACYRLAGSGSAYTCVNVTCAVGACTALIPVFVDNETCVTVQYEGYVQPTCQDVASTDGRTAWSYTFTPSPTCKNYVVTCVSEAVASATMTSEASGYNPSSVPAVLFTGGGGTGAAATAVVGFGGITSVAIVDGGTLYTNGTYLNCDLTGGSGTGAKATVIITGGVVTSVTVTTAGTGYLSTDVLAVGCGINGATVPGTLSIVSEYGKVRSLTITDGGSGYTSAPTITIAPNPGNTATATATAVLSACPAFTNNGCSGTPVVIPEGAVDVGESISVCSTSGPPVVASNYSILLSGNCLCNCSLTTIGVSGPIDTTIRYFYTTCGGAVVTGILTVGGSPSSIIVCAVTGSVVFETITAGTTGTISLGGAC